MIVGISGASGKLGRLTVEEALRHVEPDSLVITTRTPESLVEFAQKGVTVRHADFDRPESLPAAFEGIDRMFMISASNGTGKRYDEHQAAIGAAKDAGVERLVFPSMPRVDDPAHPVGLAALEYKEAEELVVDSGIPYVILRDGPYAELHVIDRFTPVMSSGELRINAREGRAGFVSRKDVARAAVEAVVGDDVILNRTYDIAGAELLSYKDLAAIISEETGIEVKVTDLEDDEIHDEALAGGVPKLLAEAIRGMGRAVREGYFGVVTDDFRVLTGREQIPVRDVVREHRQVLIDAAASEKPTFYAEPAEAESEASR